MKLVAIQENLPEMVDGIHIQYTRGVTDVEYRKPCESCDVGQKKDHPLVAVPINMDSEVHAMDGGKKLMYVNYKNGEAWLLGRDQGYPMIANLVNKDSHLWVPDKKGNATLKEIVEWTLTLSWDEIISGSTTKSSSIEHLEEAFKIAAQRVHSVHILELPIPWDAVTQLANNVFHAHCLAREGEKKKPVVVGWKPQYSFTGTSVTYYWSNDRSNNTTLYVNGKLVCPNGRVVSIGSSPTLIEPLFGRMYQRPHW